MQTLAKLNYHGAPFLFCYGITWGICGFLWDKQPDKVAAYATLFQGLVALPFALGISYLIGSFSQRPGGEIITRLSVLIAMSQLLVLPILIVFHIKKQYTMIPFIFSIVSSIHFIAYTWLYQTFFYILMSCAISIGAAVIYYITLQENRSHPDASSASKVCFLTSAAMLITAMGLLVIH
ncbi:MAG: hypothetical protein GX781_03025 [Clostridiales bacterium]|nr:hypothetical protein [Clostridiales bacterium]